MISDLRMGMVAFAAGVTLTFLFLRWRHIRWPNRLTILSFCALSLESSLVWLLVYEAGVQPAPAWHFYAADILFTLTCVFFTISIISRIRSLK